jgi:hypothetical protein
MMVSPGGGLARELLTVPVEIAKGVFDEPRQFHELADAHDRRVRDVHLRGRWLRHPHRDVHTTAVCLLVHVEGRRSSVHRRQ